jgi:uncharacterized protein
MSDRQPDPHRLDLRHFAQQADTLSGDLPQSALPRLIESVVPMAGETPLVRWAASGESRPVRGGGHQVWLHLQAQTAVQLVCQRCLQPMVEQLAVDRSFLFVPSAEEAERLDEDSEDDVLVLPKLFDAIELLEDELILALPIVPRHASCPNPLPLEAGELDDEPAPNPFAALAALRQTPRKS